MTVETDQVFKVEGRLSQTDRDYGGEGLLSKHWLVEAWWTSPTTDRPHTQGWLFAPNKKALAERLVRAINAGVVFYGAEVKTDVNNRTFVAAMSKVSGKYANADLKRLGF